MKPGTAEQCCVICFHKTRNVCQVLHVKGEHPLCERCIQDMRKGKLKWQDVAERVADLKEMMIL
jgi:hypothetical protein